MLSLSGRLSMSKEANAHRYSDGTIIEDISIYTMYDALKESLEAQQTFIKNYMASENITEEEALHNINLIAEVVQDDYVLTDEQKIMVEVFIAMF